MEIMKIHLLNFFCACVLLSAGSVFANIPGGGNGTGANVTITTKVKVATGKSVRAMTIRNASCSAP